MIYKKILSSLIFSFVLLISFFAMSSTVKADLPVVTGWIWSSNVGWISLNCSNTNTCGTSNYNVYVNTNLVPAPILGYAWSSNIGWIKFAGDASHPSPTVDVNTGNVTGWIRACAGTVTGDCNGASRTDGWDGWIKLSDTSIYPTGVRNGSKGVTLDIIAEKIRGYAWGGTTVGWLNFDNAFGLGANIPDLNLGTEITALCTLPSSVQIVDPAVSVTISPIVPTSSFAGGSAPYSYTLVDPGSWTVSTVGNTDELFIDITDSSAVPKTATISCGRTDVTKVYNTPRIKMWLDNPADVADESVSNMTIKLGSPALMKWSFTGSEIFSNCDGYIDVNTALSGFSPNALSREYSVPASVLTKGKHKITMQCLDSNNNYVNAYTYDSNGNMTGDILNITVISSRIEEI